MSRKSVVASAASKSKLILSPTSMQLWRECRRKFKLRYIDRLVPEEWPDVEALSFGKLIDQAMERRHEGASWETVEVMLAVACKDWPTDAKVSERFVRARALLRGYEAAYPEPDPWQFVGVQVQVEGPILNPAAPRSKGSQLLSFEGWLDGLILWEGALWVYELKTASRIDGAYLEALWEAPQTGLYALYVERTLGVPVAGVLYDLCQKSSPQTVRREGETEDQYQVRAAELRSMNKSGKTTAKRQMPESWGEFYQRLFEIHGKPEMYRREAIPITRDRLAAVSEELWLQGLDMRAARQDGTYYRNERSCVQWGGRECEYLPLCRSGQSQIIRENLYRVKEDTRGKLPSVN
jgi:hypothetical protein